MVGEHTFSGKKILITGSSGFIGSHLSRRLTNLGAEIHAVSRVKQPKGVKGVQWLQGDLSNFDTVREVVKSTKPELIFHLASFVKGSRELVNVMPTFRSNLMSQVYLMIAATEQGCDRFITTGSMEEPVPGDLIVLPNSPYSAAKWAASAYAKMFYALYQFPVVLLRVFMVYGPAQQDLSKLIPYVILSLLRGETPKLSSGEREVDWIYVEDVIDGILAAAQAPKIEGKTVDIGSGRLKSIKSVVQLLVERVNPDIKPLFGSLQDRPLELVRVANLENTFKQIGWRPKMDLEEGLKLTIEWYKNSLIRKESVT
jgi:nucleoside-diphosphate-sugar epimerase